MTTNQLLEQITILLEMHKPVMSGMYVLFVENEDVRFGLRSLFGKGGCVIATLSSWDVNAGLTSKMWQRIEDRIRIFKRQGVL